MFNVNINCDGSMCKFSGSVDQKYMVNLHHNRVGANAYGVRRCQIISLYNRSNREANALAPMGNTAGSTLGLGLVSDPNTIWLMRWVDSQYFMLQHELTGLYLDRSEYGHILILYPKTGGDNQQFDIKGSLIFAKGTHTVLDVYPDGSVNLFINKDTTKAFSLLNGLPLLNTIGFVELLLGENPGSIPKAIQRDFEVKNNVNNTNQMWKVVTL